MAVEPSLKEGSMDGARVVVVADNFHSGSTVRDCIQGDSEEVEGVWGRRDVRVVVRSHSTRSSPSPAVDNTDLEVHSGAGDAVRVAIVESRRAAH
jgi:hypothetical protein